MPERLTIVATWGRAIANAIESYGHDSQALFEELGLDPQRSYDPSAHYPIDKVYALLQRALEVTGDDAFGLRISRFLPNTYVPALNMLVATSENLLTGFEALCRFFKVVNDVIELKLICEKDCVFLEYGVAKDIEKLLPAGTQQMMPAVAVDATFAGMVDNVRNTLDPKFKVKRVCFRHSKPVSSQAFDDLFQAPICYDQPADRLEFDRDVLTAPLITANPELAQVNEQILKNLLESANQDQIITEIQLHILDQLKQGEPSQEDIAQSLHLSARQLRRKLQQSGTSYAQLLQDTRHDLAKKYLLQANLTVCDIAQLLGFNDQSNFSKAFKRWQGSSPASYRKQELGI